MKELLVAAEIGNIERMECIFKATEQWEMTNEWLTSGDIKKRTILHFAAIYGYMAVATCILDQIDELVKRSVNEEADRYMYINIQDYKGRTPLFYAAAEGRVKVTQLLVERGADLESPTSDKHYQPGSTPLMACCEKGTWECSEILLRNGALITTLRKDGADALYIAARYGHLTVVEQIVEDVEEVNRDDAELVVNRPTFRGRTALLTAAFHGHSLIVRKLFLMGADIDYQDDIKYTAIMYAAHEGYFELVKWLAVNGANINKKDADGNTAFKIAREKGYTNTMKYLKAFPDFEESDSDEDNLADGKSGKRSKGRVAYISRKSATSKIGR